MLDWEEGNKMLRLNDLKGGEAASQEADKDWLYYFLCLCCSPYFFQHSSWVADNFL